MAPQGLDPFALGSLALSGAGAASAVRNLIMTMLTHRPPNSAQVVISRLDAWHLLGIDNGDLVEEQIPGLVLTEDLLKAKTYLQTSGPPRLLINCSDDRDVLHDLPTRHRGQIAIVTLSTRLRDTIEVSAEGQIQHTPDSANVVTGPLPTLTRSEAYNQLMNLPTVRKPGPLDTRRQPATDDLGILGCHHVAWTMAQRGTTVPGAVFGDVDDSAG